MPLLYVQAGFPLLVVLLFGAIVSLNEISARRRRHYVFRLTVDDVLPFVPAFALLYFSAYPLGVMAYVVLFNHPALPRVVGGYVAVFALAGLAYILYPSKIERRENLPPSSLSTRLLSAFQRVAKPYNCLPSLHTAFCFYSALAVMQLGSFALGLGLCGWAGLVALSTLFTKQHYVADVLAGILVAGVVAGVVL